ncbi:MAG: penicillin-binding protein activator [Porticoccaceae bacterium]
MNKRFLLLVAYAGCILAFISGCAPTTTLETVSAPVTEIESADSTTLSRAQSLLQQAENDPQPDGLLLDAATLFLVAGDAQASRRSLLTIDAEQLSNLDYSQFIILQARCSLALNSAADAFDYLQQQRFLVISTTFGAEQQRQTIELRAEIDLALGNIEQSLQHYIRLAALSREQKSIRAVHDQLWYQLNSQPFSYLQQGQSHSDSALAGWLQLAELHRRYQINHSAQQLAYDDWRQRWRTHPAAKVPPTAIKNSAKSTSAPQQIGLLLPLQGQYETPSYTLLDGFMSAYYHLLAQDQQSDEIVPEIRLYDSSAESMAQAYNHAVEDGADIIIGPMRRAEVESLLPLEVLPVPTISLNRIDSDDQLQPQNLYQFGLSPLDEIRQIADRAWRKDQRNVLLIAPDNGWGNRASTFFNNYWSSKGGAVLSQVSYPAATKDFTPLLKPPLQIDLSEERGRQLKRFINSRIQFDVRRRQDIDLVIVLGYPVVARQIKPALDFLYASDLPVVATSHIYNGSQQVSLDRDLSRVEFSAMPWTLPGQLVNSLQPDKRLHTAYRHLYAVGHDAFLLHKNINYLESDNALPLFGATGILSLENGMVVRQPKWAVFQRGKVREIQP